MENLAKKMDDQSTALIETLKNLSPVMLGPKTSAIGETDKRETSNNNILIFTYQISKLRNLFNSFTKAFY